MGYGANLKSKRAVVKQQRLTIFFTLIGLALACTIAVNFLRRPKGESPTTLRNKQTQTQKSTKSQAWNIMPATDHADAPIAKLKPATICACAKCGTTSLWTELFAIVQGKSFHSMNYTGPPWIHNLSNKKLWTNIQARRVSDWSNFKNQDSFALIRDPKERIVSGWKSKVACDVEMKSSVACDVEMEIHELVHIVPKLLDLAGPSSNITARIKRTKRTGREYPCLDLSDFLAVLSHIHSQGKEGSLDTHFLPQHLSCFSDAPPAMWNVVTTISDPNALCSLKSIVSRSANVSNTGEDCQMVKEHNITLSLNLTAADEVILDRITRKEYEMLGSYLAQ
mmetsp:Transcript_4868/g.7984  ORF Transcript_4868/g.7984 Transcript_4868/m.7984 type:complete len:337 (+) Transcript_4868:148-1158(+)